MKNRKTAFSLLLALFLLGCGVQASAEGNAALTRAQASLMLAAALTLHD